VPVLRAIKYYRFFGRARYPRGCSVGLSRDNRMSGD
jgi:hypothetical protein